MPLRASVSHCSRLSASCSPTDEPGDDAGRGRVRRARRESIASTRPRAISTGCRHERARARDRVACRAHVAARADALAQHACLVVVPPGLAKPRGRRSLTSRSSRSAASTRDRARRTRSARSAAGSRGCSAVAVAARSESAASRACPAARVDHRAAHAQRPPSSAGSSRSVERDLRVASAAADAPTARPRATTRAAPAARASTRAAREHDDGRAPGPLRQARSTQQTARERRPTRCATCDVRCVRAKRRAWRVAQPCSCQRAMRAPRADSTPSDEISCRPAASARAACARRSRPSA